MWVHCSIAVASSLACTSSQHCELRRRKRGGAPCPDPDELDADRFFFAVLHFPHLVTVDLFANLHTAQLHVLFILPLGGTVSGAGSETSGETLELLSELAAFAFPQAVHLLLSLPFFKVHFGHDHESVPLLSVDGFLVFLTGADLLRVPEPLVDGVTPGFFRGCPLPASRGVLHT